MIRSSKLSTKFSNYVKQDNIIKFIEEYKKITQEFINLIWGLDKIPTLLPKEITSQVKTWLSARAVQCSAKQASGIVRGTRKKQSKRQFIYNKLVEQGCYKKARKLKSIIDKAKISCPQLNNICPELDSRFIKIDQDNNTSFDIWITISSIGNKLKIQIPLKKTKHFNSLKGKLLQGIRLSEKAITFMFENVVQNKENGITLGLDIGSKTLASLSDGQVTKNDLHGWNLDLINKKLSKKKKGSKSFKKTQTHRNNHINWSLNQLNLNKCKELKIEDIKNLRKGKKSSRYLSHWTYTLIYNKLEQFCESLGVQVTKINPTYTSQRCSQCGWVRKSNRNGKQFKCDKCEFQHDADLNASINIALNLRQISQKERLLHKNKTGFYWNEVI